MALAKAAFVRKLDYSRADETADWLIRFHASAC